MPLVPGHRVENCPRLLLCGGGLFAAFLGSSSPPGPPSFCGLVVCLRVHGLGRAFLAVGLSLVSCLFSSRAWLLFVVLFVVFVLLPAFLRVSFPLALVCLSWCGGAPLRLSFSWLLLAPLPCLLLPPSPLWLVPCGVLAQCLCWSLPLGIWLLLRRPGCLALMLGVWWCSVVLSSSCLMAAKAFGPVWGLYYPLHHVAGAVAVLCTPMLRYSSADDPGPPLDTAKLHCCHFWHTVWPTPLLSSSAFPAPSLPLLVCLWLCSLFSLCLPSLLSISPALTEAFEVWSSDCCESLLGLFVYVVSGCCISGKGKSSAR